MYVMIRAIKTFIQVLLAGGFTYSIYGAFDKRIIFYIAAIAFVISLTTGLLFGVPENCTDGTLYIDDSGSDKTRWTFSIDKDPSSIALKQSIHLKVKEFKEVNGEKG